MTQLALELSVRQLVHIIVHDRVYTLPNTKEHVQYKIPVIVAKVHKRLIFLGLVPRLDLGESRVSICVGAYSTIASSFNMCRRV